MCSNISSVQHWIPTTPPAPLPQPANILAIRKMTSHHLVTHKNSDCAAAEAPDAGRCCRGRFTSPSSRWLKAEQWQAAAGNDAADASGQSVTAEHGGLHSLLSHPVTLSGRWKAEMSLKSYKHTVMLRLHHCRLIFWNFQYALDLKRKAKGLGSEFSLMSVQWLCFHFQLFTWHCRAFVLLSKNVWLSKYEKI